MNLQYFLDFHNRNFDKYGEFCLIQSLLFEIKYVRSSTV